MAAEAYEVTLQGAHHRTGHSNLALGAGQIAYSCPEEGSMGGFPKKMRVLDPHFNIWWVFL